MEEVTHQVPFLFVGCINTRDAGVSLRQLTGKSGELLLVVVELVDHVHHARSNASSRNHAIATPRSRQAHKLPLAILPIMILKRECV